MPLCKNKKCRKPFIKKAANQIYCSNCSFWKRYEGGRVMKALYECEGKLKAEADASGNPKIYRAGECSQDFLKSLIPPCGVRASTPQGKRGP